MKLYQVLIASLIAAPALAADPVPPQTVMTMAGEQGYSMQCHVFPKGGDEFVRFFDSSRNSLSINALRKLECEYKGSTRGSTTITISSPTLACPFKDATGEVCATTLRKSAVGSFEAKEKRS